MNDLYKYKYLKFKTKYLSLKTVDFNSKGAGQRPNNAIVSVLNGKTIEINFAPNDPVSYLEDQVGQVMQIEANQRVRLFKEDGTPLDKSGNLQENDCGDGCQLAVVVQDTFQIFIRIPDGHHNITLDVTNDETISSVIQRTKEKFVQQEIFPEEVLALRMQPFRPPLDVLKDNLTLADYNIQAETTLFIRILH